MVSAAHINAALKAVGAGTGLVIPADQIAKQFNEAILLYGKGQFKTANSVAALLSQCMMESAYFRTTEEYDKTGRYAPFIGRTFMQVTWKDNYLKFGQWCFAKDLIPTASWFVDSPARLKDVKWAALGGVWYFTEALFHGKPLTAYSNNIEEVGKAVNLGNPYSAYTPNGQAHRIAAYNAFAKFGTALVPPAASKEGIKMYSSKYDATYQSFRGGNFAPVTIEKLKAIPTTVKVLQGGLSFASASAQTHAGIGAGDLSTRGMTKAQVWELCRQLWEVDIIPCPRGFTNDSFQGKSVSNINDGNEHIHFLDRDSYDSMHAEAKAQCREIMAGGDGLLGNAKFTGPGRSYRTAWASSAYNPKNVKTGGKYKVVSTNVQGLNISREPRKNTLRKKNYEIKAVKLVKRWGRWNAVTSQGTFYAISDKNGTYLKKV